MSVRPHEGEEKVGVSLPVIVGALVLLVAFIGFIAYKSLASREPVPVKTATSEWMEKLARESKGDITKLSPEDQAKLNSIGQPGMGAEFLKRKYESLR